MSWDSVEAKVETMLRTAFKAATDSASLTVRYKTFWNDSESLSLTFPAVVITASPAVNDGWRTTMFDVPVDVDVLTAPIDDTYGSVGRAIYGKVRQAIEEATLSGDSDWTNTAVSVVSGGKPGILGMDDDYPAAARVIPLSLVAHVAL